MRTAFAITAAIVATSLATSFAHEGHVHKFMGTVAGMDTHHIEVATREGKRESFLLSKDTKYQKGKAPVRAADVTVGARVVVSVIKKGDKRLVTKVQLGEAKGQHRGGKH